MTEVRTAHTAQLDEGELKALRSLLDAAFDGGFTDTDWDHTLGGVHAVVWEAGEPVAHGAVVQRRLLHGGRALRTGYLEGVAVRPDRRGRGHGASVMAALEAVVRGAYVLGALSAAGGSGAFYEARGWQRWQGRTCVLTPSGMERTPEDDESVHVLALPTSVDPKGVLVCEWRDGDVW
ncbi:GNAT family N-acetyltransferase [Streptomyces sp. MTZ3.1]|uniref:GNAT family N-acetyltransferase n=2 Tax=Streptomyces meridianus TaxID=2938945 RepID=A0ABT0X5F2_9ACTN|nr:GNAT family N-acetyltransferase [Streptomyces meridianus]MCM2577009.1 GNAT family N-acetyltransferase [Streptomyces meridianus]